MLAKAKSFELANQMKISYVEQGALDGIPIFLLHGLGDSWRSYEPVLRHLPVTIRAFALSQRGHGDSGKPGDGYRIRDFAGDLEMFFDGLGVEAALLIGHSSHGLVCERFAIDHPDRTLGLVLIGTPLALRGNPRAQEMLDQTISKLTDPIHESFARDFSESTLARPVPPAFLETMRAETMKVPARVFKELFKDLIDTDLRPELNRIAAPALLVWGDQDAILSRPDQDELVKALPHSRLVVYPGAGHAPHWEDPRRFAYDLASFVAELRRPVR